MARKPKFTPAKSGPTLFGIGLKAGLTVFLGIGLLATLVGLGQKAGESVAGKPRYQIPVADIQCDVPPGKDRAAFLSEVRALGPLPETVSAVSPETPPLLAAAFAKHPWVAAAPNVRIAPDRTILVDLTFRVPVVAFKVTGERPLRMADKTGTVLPVGPVPELLPMLKGDVQAADASVKRAAEIVDMLKDKKPRTIEKTFVGWRVTLESGGALIVGW